METIANFDTARQAHEAGFKIFASVETCKHGHINPMRRVAVKKNNISGRCMVCEAKSNYKYQSRDDFTERRASISKRWRSSNPDYGKNWKCRTLRADSFYNLLSSIRCRCAKRGIPFDLDSDYLRSILPSDMMCPIMKVPMIFGKNGTPKQIWLSVDRLKPELGYVRGNVAFMSCAANAIKQDCVDPEVFQRMADWMRLALAR